MPGEVDEETARKFEAPRCGNKDVSDKAQSHPQNTFALAYFSSPVKTFKWSKWDITYKVESYARSLSKAEVENTFKNAFKTWANASGLTIKNTDKEADIVIKYA